MLNYAWQVTIISSGYTVKCESVPVPRQQRRLLEDAQWAPEGVDARL